MSRAKTRVVFLVGFMGAGKTVTGEALACQLGWRFIDLDQRVEAREGRSIAEIFAKDGEAGFRGAEIAALGDVLVSLQERTVVALGGGTFVDPENAGAIQRAGTVVFLNAPVEVLWQRVPTGAAERPLITTETEFIRRYEQRLGRYRTADAIIDTGNKSVAEVAAEIATRLRLNNTRER